MGRAAADNRSRPNRLATPNAATPRSGQCNRQALQLFELLTCNVNLSLGGFKGGYSLLWKRVSPFVSCSARGAALPCRLQGVYSILHNSTIMVTNRISVLPQIFQFQNYVNFDTRLSAQYVFHSAEIKSIFPCQIRGFWEIPLCGKLCGNCG